MTRLLLNIMANGIISLTSLKTDETIDKGNSLASIQIATHYNFDDNVIAKVHVIDSKTASPTDDPLNHLIFNIEFRDKVDNSLITTLQGRLFTGGGVETLAEKYPKFLEYVSGKLDFYAALDDENDFIEEVITQYDKEQAEQIITALKTANIINSLSSFRIKDITLDVPASEITDMTAEQLKRMLLDMKKRPRYLATREVDNLTIIESLAEVISRLNIHLFIDIGALTDWRMAVALANSFDFNDHRIALFWSPNKSRPRGATTVLARKKWRPVIGDYLGQLLLRNANTNNSGIAPVHVPIAGYDFPLGHRDLEKLEGVILDEEAQNALAEAKINVILSENFTEGERWIYGDVLTQYDSKTSALRLINSSEVATYLQNNAISIAKRHLLKPTSSYIDNADRDIRKMLDACVASGLIQMSSELGGYYSINVTPRADNPFEKMDIKMVFRPEGCVRQVFFETTVTR